MAEKILLLGCPKKEEAGLAKLLAGLGYATMTAAWEGFSPRNLGRERPNLILADADQPGGKALEAVCRESRLRWGDAFPVVAMSTARKFFEISVLLDAGATTFVGRNPDPETLDRKLVRCLSDSRRRTTKEEEPLPPHLASVFSSGGLVRLGELASVHPGVAPRRPTYRRMAPPDEDWRGVVTADIVDRFFNGKTEAYLKWSRFHLFRLPHPDEYSVMEKVIVRRAGPPLAAAVDRSRLPVGADMYSVVPYEEGTAGFLACILNSRLMDFYFNRLANTSGDGRLRLEDLREAPFPRPAVTAMQELAKSAALLAHYGPNPESWFDRQSKDQLWEHMEETVFSLYGVREEAREELAALHF